MKISFISGNLCDGGAQRVISVIASELAERGHEVNIFVFARNEKEYSVSSKVNISAISDNFEDYSKISLIKRIVHIRKFLKKVKPDVAVGFLEGGYGLYLASFGLKVKKVASARIDPKVIWRAKGFRAKINRRWFNSADAVVLQTNSQLDNVPQKVRKRSTVIANPVSETALLKNKDYIYQDSCRKIVMFGRLEPQKNYPMVFDAIKIVKEKYLDVSVDVFGKGSIQDKLTELLKTNNIEGNISLKGWTQNTMEECLNHDIFVLSSNFEGMPNALMEAMAVGLPSISTDCPTGPSDLITDGENGFLVKVNDREELAEKILEIMDMTLQQRKQLGTNAHRTIKEGYNKEVIVDNWENLFNKLIKD